MIRSLLVSVTLPLAAFAAVAHAQPPEVPREGPPREGPRGPRQQVFISPAGEPFRAAPDAPYPVAAWFARADADKDGKLDRKEFTADALVFFDTLDTDKDGIISSLENTAYENKVAPEILPTADRSGLGGPPPGGARKGGPRPGDKKLKNRRVMAGMSLQGAAPYSLLNEPQPVRGADADFNFRITKAEFETTARKRFTILDTDGDGFLILDALPQTPVQQMRENMAALRRE
ncbi:hypothetical protein P7B02_09910 [Caulobacter segnis]|uniref:hypothetical protein n=1 Tax=Caulobacter segnis TaxID=88688 RepID=UPI00240FBCFC|nr:hypothetical protein [Caulobacter segnis]MDG2521857.1 hypothetical protein [Caulobacter segnis]